MRKKNHRIVNSAEDSSVSFMPKKHNKKGGQGWDETANLKKWIL
jgi:hypothetical protein